MDNVTHTLAGLVAAHAALFLRARRGLPKGRPSAPAHPQTGSLQIATLTVSALANNAPDLDFVYRGITPGKLGYLLHHRGHTHTLLAALPLGLLSVACVLAVLRLLGQRVSRSDLGFLIGVASFGGVLHVALDFCNNYGVHPFWPLDDHWYYADLVFIVEPWLLIALGGIALGASRRAVSRAALALIVAGLLAVAWLQALGPSPLLAPTLALLLTIGAGLWLAWMGWAAPRWRRRSGALGLGLLLSAQLLARQQARAEVRRALGPSLAARDGAARDGAARDGASAATDSAAFELVSLASTPLPANPLCWSVLAVGVAGAEYVVRQALVSGWPRVWPARECRWPSAGFTAPLAPPAARTGETPAIVWGLEFRAPLAELRALARDDCAARAFLRFARVPFWIQDRQRATLIGDLRYDRSAANEFAELRLEPEQRCPRLEPPWRPPLPLLDGGYGPE